MILAVKVMKKALSLLKIETHDVTKLKDEKLEKFKEFFAIDWEPASIFFNRSNLILTDKNEVEAISPYVTSNDLVFRMELPDYNIHFFVFRIVNNTIIRDILEINEALVVDD